MAKEPKMTKAKKAKKAKLEKERKEHKAKIIQIYSDIAEQYGTVSMADMKCQGYTKDMVTHHFGSLTKLNEEARESYPEKFFDIYITDTLDDKSLKKALKKHKRFIITTAVTGCRAHSGFVKALENYCSKRSAHVLLTMASDPTHNKFAPGANYGTVDSQLAKSKHISTVSHDVPLNSNISISTIKVAAKQIDPATSMCRIAAVAGSFIFASPKQRLKMVPQQNGAFPKCVMTSGAITYADYTTDNYMSGRTAWIASHDHTIGAIIVEIQDNEVFHFRQIQAAIDGSFIDLGIQYNTNGTTTKVKPEAFVLGDWHAGSTSPTAKAAWKEVIKELGVKQLIMHDLFDGSSINHHERHNVIAQHKTAHSDLNSLKSEIEFLAKDLDELTSWVDKVIVVKSNHDDFLNRYLQSGWYVKDPTNHRYALELAIAYMDGGDPLEFAMAQETLKRPNKINWLAMDESYKIADIELGVHGHRGSNGARGSIQSMELGYGRSVSGHSHTPGILRDAWAVGTSTHLKLGYMRVHLRG